MLDPVRFSSGKQQQQQYLTLRAAFPAFVEVPSGGEVQPVTALLQQRLFNGNSRKNTTACDN